MSSVSEDEPQSSWFSKIYPTGKMSEAEVLDHNSFNFTGTQLYHWESSSDAFPN